MLLRNYIRNKIGRSRLFSNHEIFNGYAHDCAVNGSITELGHDDVTYLEVIINKYVHVPSMLFLFTTAT